MSNDVHHEERRLRRIFRRALWLSLAAPLAAPLACSSGGTATTASSTSSASGTGGGGGTGTGGADAGATDAGDAGDASDPCAYHEFTPDPPDMCGTYMRLPCGLPPKVMSYPDCTLLLSDCADICKGPFFSCHSVDESCVDGGGVVPDPDGGVTIDCSTCPSGVGRVPAGLARARMARAPGPLGDYFAAVALLEAASVHAFRRLGEELAVHRAPARLRRAARRAQHDEIRHARLTTRMARRFGGAPPPARVEPIAPRPLDLVALENTVEGCVRETFGALVASFQAVNARDPEIARMMAGIARDETRHAALSWAVARWAGRRLGAEPRARLDAQCRAAIEGLRREAEAPVAGELVERAGLPNAAQQRALLDALEGGLWQEHR